MTFYVLKTAFNSPVEKCWVFVELVPQHLVPVVFMFGCLDRFSYMTDFACLGRLGSSVKAFCKWLSIFITARNYFFGVLDKNVDTLGGRGIFRFMHWAPTSNSIIYVGNSSYCSIETDPINFITFLHILWI